MPRDPQQIEERGGFSMPRDPQQIEERGGFSMPRDPQQIEERIGQLNAAIRILCAPREPQTARARRLFELTGEILGLEWALGREVK
jgi:hypothetical protein